MMAMPKVETFVSLCETASDYFEFYVYGMWQFVSAVKFSAVCTENCGKHPMCKVN